MAFSQEDPTIYRVSFAERSDGKGHVARLHATARIDESSYEVDLLGRNQVLVLLHGVRLAGNVQQDPSAGPVVDYSIRQRRQRVEVRFRMDEDAGVSVVYYPDRESTDFLLALNHSQSYPPIILPPRSEENVSDASENTVDGGRQEQAENTGVSVDNGPRDASESVDTAREDTSPDSEERATDLSSDRQRDQQPSKTNASGANRRNPDEPSSDQEIGQVVRIDAPVLPVDEPQQEVVTTSADVWELDCIVIDAGHGGKDPGAMGNGLREKDVALSIALRLGRAIEERLGIRVVYTRTDDRFVELQQRGRIANEAGGKLFVSIHVDAIGGSRARTVQGTSTYFLGLHRTDAAARVMELENAVVKLESDPDKYAAFNEDDLIVRTLTQSAYLTKSEQLADRIQSHFEHSAGRSSRGVKQAGLIVLWAASMPAVLVETGFATHPNEARYLLSESGQTEIADAIFQAIREFHEDYQKEIGLSKRIGE